MPTCVSRILNSVRVRSSHLMVLPEEMFPDVIQLLPLLLPHNCTWLCCGDDQQAKLCAHALVELRVVRLSHALLSGLTHSHNGFACTHVLVPPVVALVAHEHTSPPKRCRFRPFRVVAIACKCPLRTFHPVQDRLTRVRRTFPTSVRVVWITPDSLREDWWCAARRGHSREGPTAARLTTLASSRR